MKPYNNKTISKLLVILLLFVLFFMLFSPALHTTNSVYLVISFHLVSIVQPIHLIIKNKYFNVEIIRVF